MPQKPSKPGPQVPNLVSIQGCLLGGALGDALGSRFEGLPAGEDRILNVGRVTDDTQMTMATAEAVVDAGGVDAATIAQHYGEWFKHGEITDVGSSTLCALRSLEQGGHWALVGARGEQAAGAGAAMRIAPLAFFLDPHEREHRVVIRDVCRITHHNEEAYAGALAVLIAVRRSWLFEEDLTLSAIADRLPDSLTRDRLRELASSSFETVAAAARITGTSGHAAEAVPLAIAVAAVARGFAHAMTSVVQLGGDTDTIASMSGQIIGTRIGVERLPRELVRHLPERHELLDLGERLLEVLDAPT